MSEIQKPEHKKKASRPAWQRILCALLIILAIIVVLASAAIGGIVWMLTPERLTTLVVDTANGYLDAEVKTSRIELTWWSTWPQLCIEIDSMEIVSHSLNNLPDDVQAQLPTDADTLLRIDHINGTVNLAALLDMNVELRDVKIVKPWINLVTADSLHANYLITGPTEPNDSSAVLIPPLTINRFEVEGPGQIRYASLTDSTDITLAIHNIGLNSMHNPVYTVTTSGIMNAQLASILPSLTLPLSVDGRVAWDNSKPFTLSINDMSIVSGAISLTADMTVEAESDPTISTMSIRLNPVPVDSLLSIIPAPYNHMTQGISCRGLLSTNISLRSPYNMVTDSLPDADINIVLTPGQVKYDKIRLRNLEAEADITLHNTGLDATVINIRKLRAYGPVIDAKISARLQNIISNPYINGDFNGMLNLTRLSSLLSKRGRATGLTIEGRLHGNARYRLRASDLNPRNFYRTRISGNVKLSDFCAYDSTTRAEVGEMLLKFGTSTSFTGRNGRIDSLLTVSMAFDTAAITTPDLILSLSDVKAGIGAENRKASTDTSTITPIGASMHIGRVDYKSSADSSRILLRTINGRTMLRQFAQATGRVPEIGLDISTSLAIFLDRNMRVAMRDGHFDLMAHLNDRTQVLGPRAKARYDSLRVVHPELPQDSLISMAMRTSRQRYTATDEGERLNLALDNTTAGFVRRLDLRGTVKAKSMGLFTPAFPLRSRFSNMECDFTTDSILFHNMDCKIGSSDFAVKGTVSNIKRTLTSANTRRPLKIEVSMQSDSINVNEILHAMLRGATYNESANHILQTEVNASDETVQKAVEDAADAATGALLVPRNIDASMKATARHITYADVKLKDFTGTLLVNRGAIKLEDMRASSDVGTASLNALYYAPVDTSIMFGMGLKLHDFHIDKVIDLIPQIDSLMPIMSTMGGVIDADLTAATRIDTLMNIDMASMKAMLQLSGDSLVLLDEETFKTMAKWLMFKDKKKNMIKHMDVAVSVENSMMRLYPFTFDFDRYHIGVMGGNDLDMNLDYHVSVMKSPLPFKFGINITGPADDMKIRVGKARMKENMVQNISIGDTTRINFVDQLDRLFRRGVAAADRAAAGMDFNIMRSDQHKFTADDDSISHTDSLTLINEGLIAAPATPQTDKGNKKGKLKRK